MLLGHAADPAIGFDAHAGRANTAEHDGQSGLARGRSALCLVTCAAGLILSSCQGDRRPEVSLSCRTSKTAAVTATAPDAHGHPVHELFMPLSGTRNRCPRRGRIEVVLHTSPSEVSRSVHLLGLGADRREQVKAGPGVAVAALPLAGLSTGTHALSVEVDGRAVLVPAVLVTP